MRRHPSCGLWTRKRARGTRCPSCFFREPCEAARCRIGMCTHFAETVPCSFCVRWLFRSACYSLPFRNLTIYSITRVSTAIITRSLGLWKRASHRTFRSRSELLQTRGPWSRNPLRFTTCGALLLPGLSCNPRPCVRAGVRGGGGSTIGRR